MNFTILSTKFYRKTNLNALNTFEGIWTLTSTDFLNKKKIIIPNHTNFTGVNNFSIFLLDPAFLGHYRGDDFIK